MRGTRDNSTIQKVKKIALFTPISTTRMMNAPRSAIADRTLVAMSALANRVVALTPGMLPSVHLKSSHCTVEGRANDQPTRGRPDGERERQHAARHQGLASSQRRRSRQERGERGEARDANEQHRIELERKHQAPEHEEQFLPDPVRGSDVAEPEGRDADPDVKERREYRCDQA